MKRLFALLTVLLAGIGAAHGKDLYVNNSGSPACSDATTYANNDANNPWCSILRAVSGQTDGNRNTAANGSIAAAAGDTVYVTAGTYDYSGASWTSPSSWVFGLYEFANGGTSWSNPIRLVASGTVTLTASSTVIGPVFSVQTEYIEINGFTAVETTTFGGEPFVTIRDDHVRLYNMNLSSVDETPVGGNNRVGIMIHGPRDADCTAGIDDIHIKDNEVYNFTVSGTADANNANAMTVYCSGHATAITIENNYFHDNEGLGIMAKSSYIDPTVDPSYIVRKNLFDGNGNGLRIQAWMGWHIYQNVFIDGATAIHFHATNEDAGGSTKPRDMYIVNNTFDNMLSGFYMEGDCADFDGNVFQNNIYTNGTDTLITEGAADCESTANIGTDDISFNYNVYENSGAWWDSPAVTYSVWQSSYGQDANSSNSADCLYANEAADDFRLCTAAGEPDASCSERSPCLEDGANDGVDILDLDGDSSTVDAITIGAFITGDEVIGLTETESGSTAGLALFLGP